MRRVLKNNSGKEYERWLWIELIGFDNQKSDLGVTDYLGNLGFIPEAVSLLISSPDFIHNYDGTKQCGDFPADFCSYFGRPYSEERERQVWTKYQLRRLIDKLHDHRISVYLSVFTTFLGNKFHNEWVSDHLEILETKRNGERNNAINPLRRFRDGTYYEDFFIKKLVGVLIEYGFDGYHGADGYNHLRLPLYEIDYSDDMIEQFTEMKKVEFPESIAPKCDGSADLMEKRADWIWRNKRLEWIEFLVDRWERFWQRVVTALHKEGKQVVINTAWTRDPFEAIYRYGIDYKRIAGTGIDGLIVETLAGSVTTAGQGAVNPHPLYNSLAMLLLIKSCVPDVKLILLNYVRDTVEQWDVLHHAPTFLERGIFSFCNMYYHNSKVGFKRCVEGLLVCLADSIRQEEWTWLQDRWDLGFSEIPQHTIGPTLVCSDKAFENQVGDFLNTRSWTIHRIVYHLMAKGCPVQSVTNVDYLGTLRGAVLVVNPHLFSGGELNRIFGYEGGPVIVIGRKTASFPEPDFQFADIYSPNQLFCGVYGLKRKFEIKVEKCEEEKLPDDITGLREPFLFTQELYFRKVSDGFLESCVQVISGIMNTIDVSSDEKSVKVLAMKQGERKLRLLIGNDACQDVGSEFDVGQEIAGIKVLTKFPGMPIVAQGSRFRVKIPGRGAVVLDITLDRDIEGDTYETPNRLD